MAQARGANHFSRASNRIKYLRSAFALPLLLAFTSNASETLYVDRFAAPAGQGESWESAFRFLQDALAKAAELGDTVMEIRIAQGVYKPDRSETAPQGSGDRAAAFHLINGVELKGGYAGVMTPDPDLRDISIYRTILSGDLSGDDEAGFLNYDDNSYHIAVASGTDQTAVLDGLTLRGGNADEYGWLNGDGAALDLANGSATICDCSFVANNAIHSGGAIRAHESSGAITRCSFTNNRSDFGGAGSIGSFSNVTFVDCSFESNTGGPGGALCIWNSTIDLLDCSFIGNQGTHAGSLYINDYSECTLIGSFFEDNFSAWYGYSVLNSRSLLVCDSSVIDELENRGSVSTPEGATGAITVDGKYTQRGYAPDSGDLRGYLNIKLGGAIPVEQHDVIKITDYSHLAGALVVSLIDECEPHVGDSFEILIGGTVNDQFDIALLPGLPDGKFMRVVYDDGIPHGRGGSVSLIVDQLSSLFGFDDPTSIPLSGTPTGVVLGDFDIDEINGLDLAIALPDADPELNGSVLIFLNAGIDDDGNWLGFSGLVQQPVGRAPSSLAVGHFDDDQHLDLVVTNAADDSILVLYNNGNGQFSSQVEIGVGQQPSAVADFHLNGDGLIDLAVANAAEDTVHILTNDGSRGFTFDQTLHTGAVPIEIDPWDIDHNTDVDLIIINGGDASVGVYQSQGGEFEPPMILSVGNDPVDLSLADFDQNGFEDFVVINEGDGTVSVILNEGDDEFAPAIDMPVGANPRSIATIDLELDGDVDIVLVADLDETPVVQVLRNDLNDGDQLIFAGADEFDVGEGLAFVVAGDMNDDAVDDLVAVTAGVAGSSSGTAMSRCRGDGSVDVLLNALNDCPADINDDAVVDVIDLLLVFAAWGQSGDAANVNGDGVVDIHDLLAVLAAWGPC